MLPPVIERVSGTLLEVSPGAVVIELLGGLGVHVAVTGRTAQSCGRVGERVTLLTAFLFTGAQDPQPRLFGFESREGRELFHLLRGVSGIGPNTALRVLECQPTPADVAAAIARGEVAALKAKGVGPKTAKRIVTELKDKVGAVLSCLPAATVAPAPVGRKAPLGTGDRELEDAFLALKTLEFDPQRARQLLLEVRRELVEADAEELLRAVLLRS